MTYTDYNGVERTEDLYFNLTKAEVMEMEMSTKGGLAEMIQRIIAAQDQPAIIKIFKDLIIRSYGVKSPDGKRFIKNQEVVDEFVQTEAFSDLFMELATNADKAAEFINGVVPADMAKQLEAETKKNTKKVVKAAE
jgi:hypothetical protein